MQTCFHRESRAPRLVEFLALLLVVGGVACTPTEGTGGGGLVDEPEPAGGSDEEVLVSPTPAATEGPDLTVRLDGCALVPGGSITGADALSILVHVPNLAPGFPVEPGVVVAVDSDVGLGGSATGGTTEGSTVRPAQVDLLASDYGGPLDLRITVDPENEIPEVDEDNNRIVVRVELPSSQPSEAIDPLPCRSVR